MKSTTLLLVALTATISALAQSKLVLRAQSYYNYPAGAPSLIDSISFVHHDERNSSVTVPPPSHAWPQTGVYNADTVIYVHPPKKSGFYSSFNAAGLITEYTKVTFSSGMQDIYEQTFYTYNSSMLPDTITFSTKWGNNSKTVHLYNNNKLSEKRFYSWSNNSTSWEPAFRLLYAYVGSKLVELKQDNWNPASTSWESHTIDSFIASGSGSDSTYRRLQFNGSTYTEWARYKYIRDAANRILTDSFFHNGSVNSVHHYTYDASGKLLLDSMIGQKHVYLYDAQSNLVSRRSYYGTDQQLDTFTYNSANLVTSWTEYDSSQASGGAWKKYGAQFYYYDFPVNVAEAATAKNTLQLYPVPATSYINISMSFTKSQPFIVRIFDMQGRLVSNWQEAAQSTYSKQLPILNFPPGQYTLHILAGEESVSRQFSVVR